MKREMIEDYFHDNGMDSWTPDEEMEFIERRRKYEKARMAVANVNEQDEARHFFNEYDIPFKIMQSGPNKGRLAIIPVREIDQRRILEAKDALERNGFEWVIDHSNVFRDDKDRSVVTFSPYMDRVDELCGIVVDNYEVTVSAYSIYGMATPTIVCREMTL